jgi:glucose/arabinose dehydrogenase
MHLRRAVVLFAIVLGIAAVAASLAPHPSNRSSPSSALGGGTQTTAAPPTPVPAPSTDVTMSLVRGKPPTETVRPGSHLVLTVTVNEPGQVSFLGDERPAEADTPATFDVLAPGSGRLPVTFTPAAGGAPRSGTIVVRAPRR